MDRREFDLQTIEELWTFNAGKTHRHYIAEQLGSRIRAIATLLECAVEPALKRLWTHKHGELLELYQYMTFGGTP